ncbi:unnamed protein product [Lactuca saligna]|uniref:Uncharacterized protein n=1 Tax=Lactuca saligna TaxID=75948 RepID=A0AA35YEI2_LACSI|nr:unnamed protein product [Lactuca saligna]
MVSSSKARRPPIALSALRHFPGCRDSVTPRVNRLRSAIPSLCCEPLAICREPSCQGWVKLSHIYNFKCKSMKFLDWYVKIAVVSAAIGGSMEYFMIKTGFYDKVTVLESEKKAWENSPEAQAMREALNPWRNIDANAKKSS